MAKPEWGMKRVCQNPDCRSRYYDYLCTPIVCPACNTVFDPEAVLKSRRARSLPAEDPKEEQPEIEEDEIENEEEIDEDEESGDENEEDGTILTDDEERQEVLPKLDEDGLDGPDDDDDDDLVDGEEIDESDDEEEEDL